MYAYLERITLVTCAKKHSGVVHTSKMGYAVVIIQNMYYPDFHTKFNLNAMVVIGLCLMKEYIWNTSVPQTKKHTHLLLSVAHAMLCFTHSCLVTANKMQLLQL